VSTFLRYTANTKTLQDIVGFLFAECCTRNGVVVAVTAPTRCCAATGRRAGPH
jgi:hypothetical protein